MASDNNDSANVYYDLIGRHLSEGRGDKIAVYCDGRKYRYNDLSEGALRVAARLSAMGFHPEQRIALLLEDSPEFLFWFLGALYYGAIPVPLNTFASSELLNFYLNDSRARILVSHQKKRDIVRAARESGISNMTQVIWAEDECYSGLTSPAAMFNADPDDVALWLYTSGSTSRPKAATHRHAGLIEICKSYAHHVLKIGENDIAYSTSKLFFAYGLGNSLLFPLFAGASTVLLREKTFPEAVFGIITRYRPTLFFSIPSLYNLMVDHPACNADMFSGIRICVSAGENLPKIVLHKWQRTVGQPILDGIGSTEAAHIFCSNTAESIAPGSSGKPVPGYELRVVDDDGQDVCPGEVGQLLVRGNSIAKGYWNRYELTRTTFRGEWLATGDLFRQDADGQYIYMGRQGDVFKVSGQWVSPVEIEQLLLAHDSVAEAAVIGAPDRSGLTQAHAFVVQRDGWQHGNTEVFKQNLISYLSESLPKYKVPGDITSIQTLPKTATGKVARALLRNGALEQQL